ncbi:MAG: class I SAM-dependent methyltransferase [Trueperaceae bacterium]|nr:class I SAM-dependent methyltransferase [Trueperaceae bacterium]
MTFDALEFRPEHYDQAKALAARFGFADSSSNECGRLLRTLLAQAKAGSIAEIGTGCGLGTAWLLSALRTDQTLYSVERDEARHRAVKALYENQQAQFIWGDWERLLDFAPFEFVFVDVGVAKDHGAKKVIDAVRLGGLIVLDDFTPHKYWPADWKGREDIRRARWLSNERLIATELLLTERSSAIVATKIK